MIAALCIVALFVVAGWLTLDMASEQIAQTFTDAFNALRGRR